MKIGFQEWSGTRFIKSFFPLQLIVAQLKYNLITIFAWISLFLIVSDTLGYSFGIPLLFLSPEYLGEVSNWSFLLLGFAMGGFIMGYNTYSYIQLGPYFPFLTTLSRPFFKFCLNNSILPTGFILFYAVRIALFQSHEEIQSPGTIALFLLFFFLGQFLFFAISFLYFFRVSPIKERDEESEQSSKPVDSFIHKKTKWYDAFRQSKEQPYIYIGSRFKLHTSRSSKHFDKELIERVFAKNRINSSIYELSTIGFFILLGAFNGYRLFEVPAAVSITLLFTIALMLFSAMRSWFKNWTYLVIVIALLGMNYLSEKTGLFDYANYLYGLSYQTETKENYTIQQITEIAENKQLQEKSMSDFIQSLDNWKKNTGEDRPKLIIVNTSGGGSRSALWTTIVLQEANKALRGDLAKKTQLITGASGGMIGAAYFRELALRYQLGQIEDPNQAKYAENISKDLLNRLSFMASTNDLFFRYQKHEYNGDFYTKDRGYAFEEQLHQNTHHIMDHPLSYYEKYEKQGVIPTMIFSPTIVNDGRRMLIAAQNLAFLTYSKTSKSKNIDPIENIDFHSLLSNQNTSNTRFSSVLRASATFPFVMPMVTIPTTPEIQLMDAGIRDNYGMKTMIEYLNTLKSWIKQNTSGVIVIQIRDTQKILDDEHYDQISFIDKLTLPFGNMYKNFPRVQDFNQDELLRIAVQTYQFPIDLIVFNLREKQEDRISLSWHLTKQEKIKIRNSFNSRKNQASLKQLQLLL